MRRSLALTLAVATPVALVACSSDSSTVEPGQVASPVAMTPSSLGCYADSSNRDLPYLAYQNGTNTTENCISACKSAGYAYAGTQYSSQCFCGNSYGGLGTSTNCNMSCSGNSSEICGGGWANSVYPTSSSSPSSGGWTQCAPENGNCAFSGTMSVAYGANGRFNYGSFTGGTACNNGVFGDPNVGTVKACYLSSLPPSGAWTQCAVENASCSFSGTMAVAYGANGDFRYGSFTNGTACNNGVFGDPIVGTVKACYMASLPSAGTSPVNGACGSANGVAVSSAPTANLCRSGTATAVTGSGPWNWSCHGSSGGTDAACSAPVAAGTLPAPIAGTNYKLVWDDEFSGTSINTANWNQVGPWGHPTGSGWANFSYPSLSGDFSSVSVANGTATITAQNTGGGPLGTWTGGILNTGPTISGAGPNKLFTYGFFEAYGKLPSGGGQGFWPAFWLVGNDGELDVMEFYGDNIDNFPQTLHYRAQSNQIAVQNTSPTGDWTQAYHLFQLLWTSSGVTFYVDNAKTASYTAATLGGIPSQPMMMMLNFDVGDWRPVYPNSATPSPAYFNIDYVRVYQQ